MQKKKKKRHQGLNIMFLYNIWNLWQRSELCTAKSLVCWVQWNYIDASLPHPKGDSLIAGKIIGLKWFMSNKTDSLYCGPSCHFCSEIKSQKHRYVGENPRSEKTCAWLVSIYTGRLGTPSSTPTTGPVNSTSGVEKATATDELGVKAGKIERMPWDTWGSSKLIWKGQRKGHDSWWFDRTSVISGDDVGIEANNRQEQTAWTNCISRRIQVRMSMDLWPLITGWDISPFKLRGWYAIMTTMLLTIIIFNVFTSLLLK